MLPYLLFLLILANVAGGELLSSQCEVNYIDDKPFTLPAAQCGGNGGYSSMRNSLLDLMRALIPEGSMVVDVMSGYGISYAVLAKAVGSAGTVVAIERSARLFQLLQQNAARNEAWSRTLLVHGDASDVVNSKSSQPLDVIVGQLGFGCPHLLRFNAHEEADAFNVLIALIGTQAVIERCQPMLVIDIATSGAQAATAIIDLLVQVRPGGEAYELYWGAAVVAMHSQAYSGDTERYADTRTRIELLVAIPQGTAAGDKLVAEGALRPLAAHRSLVFDPTAPTMWEHVEQQLGGKEANASSLTVVALRVRVPLSAHLLDLVALNSSLRTAHRVAAESLQGLAVIRFDYDFSSTFMVDNFGVIAASRCAVWTFRLSAQLYDDAGAGVAAGADLRALRSACTDFLTKRFRMTHHILYLRALQLFEDEQSRNNATPAVQLDGAGPAEQHSQHTFYDLGGAEAGHADSAEQIMAQWLTRAPFTTAYDDTVCGEPIWCSHTLEVQRRIRAWQYPEEPSAPLPQHVAMEEPGEASPKPEESARSRVADWSQRDGTATCASSRFLVYEPPSYGHGIGSMLELIAAAFRYAICLDRILILNPYAQPATLLKWRHPGCQGNFVECAFEPVSGCVLTEEEVAAAPESKEGYGFATFPLRDERILVLKGMPMTGECALCYSDWKVDNKFFDGLFTGETLFDRSTALLHMAAFRGASKQTWASQFLRYLLRPRPWLSEALSQLAVYSMRSPVEVEPSRPSPQRLLQSVQFPRRFLSLHVRFGMKTVEAVLQPLSRYMEFIAKKLPELTDIFLSTETEEVIHTLVSEYPEYRFHYMRYPRRVYLDLALAHQDVPYNRETDYVEELLFSLANLHVAAEAHAFVGTLTSNWCMMIMHLERTRGDGGYDYYSVDKGSAFTGCF